MLEIYKALAELLAVKRQEEFNDAVEGNPRQPHEVVELIAAAIAELMVSKEMKFFDRQEFYKISQCNDSIDYTGE